MKFTVQESESLLNFVIKHFPDSSKTTLRSWIEEGRFMVDGKEVYDGRCQVRAGVGVEFAKKPVGKGEPFKIIFEDRHIVVIDKPVGLLSVARDSGNEFSAHSYLQERYYPHQVYVVHRLDQETSGLLLFARTEIAFQGLKEQLKARTMKRVYEALIEGELEGEGIWESYLRDEGMHVSERFEPLPGYEKAVTFYRTLRAGPMATLMEFKLQTGKKHQIRVQAASHGHPIVGDVRYGAQASLGRRLCLHAKELEFTHPVTGKVHQLTSQVPPLFVKSLRLMNSTSH